MAFQRENFRVALVCMPFFAATQPSIQIGLLRSIGERGGFAVDAFHLNLHFAARLTPKIYSEFSMHRGHLTAEWLFSKAAFGSKAVTAKSYCEAFPSVESWIGACGLSVNSLQNLQDDLVPRFLKECMNNDWGKYAVVGFSSTFQQNVASLALANRIKKKYPAVKILFGGANMEGEMGIEYLRSFSYIDYVSVGEGDFLFPELLLRLSTDRTIDDVPGLAFRSNGDVKMAGYAPPLQDMDTLPTPNYDEYFERAKNLKLDALMKNSFLPVETARGCWWGEKHHCTFCGLNGLNMKFRAKSTKRVLSELAELSTKYDSRSFSITDNILDLKYLKDLFIDHRHITRKYSFAWEVKANLTREQLRNLYLGGIRELQPGIESLNSHVLQLMRKGCSMLQNLNTLRWCRFYRIQVLWNLLYGFPGETAEDYRQELSILKLISHLGPPIACDRIWLERFAPYYFDRTFPVSNVRAEASYGYVYPSHVALDKIAYYFDYEMGETLPEKIHLKKKEWVLRWQRGWYLGKPDFLTFAYSDGKLSIKDGRSLINKRVRNYRFNGPKAFIYQFCSDTYHSVWQVRDYLETKTASKWNEIQVRALLDSYCSHGLMAREDGKYLALALPAPVYGSSN